MSQELLLDTARDWFISVHPDIECIIAEQTTAPPALEADTFGMLRVVGMRRQGRDGTYLKYDSSIDKFNEIAFSVKEITLSLDVFTVDDSAEDVINEALVSLSFQDTGDIFSAKGFGMLSYEESINLSKLISARYNRRFRSEIKFGVNVVYQRLINRIVQVNYSGDLENTTISDEVKI
ncbi:hypothetical protein EBU24_01010 [bacterium]|nr:hypothetical protein [bacterium]